MKKKWKYIRFWEWTKGKRDPQRLMWLRCKSEWVENWFMTKRHLKVTGRPRIMRWSETWMSCSTRTDDHKHSTAFKMMKNKKVPWQDEVMLACRLCSICFTTCWSAETKLLNTYEAAWTVPASHLHTVGAIKSLKPLWNVDLVIHIKSTRKRKLKMGDPTYEISVLNMETVKLAKQHEKKTPQTCSFFLCAET